MAERITVSPVSSGESEPMMASYASPGKSAIDMLIPEPYQIDFTSQEIEELLTKVQNLEHEIKDSDNPISSRAVYFKFNELEDLITISKQLLAKAITSKGIDTSENDTFHQMAINVSNIQQGGKGVSLFCFPCDSYESTTSYMYGTNTDVVHITEDINELEIIKSPNLYYFDNIGTMDSTTLFMYGENADVIHITENITERDNIYVPNLYYFNNIETIESTVKMWSHHLVEIMNEREEY